MPASVVNPFPISIVTSADIVYGEIVKDFTETTSNGDFSKINTDLKNGETVNTLDVKFTKGKTGADPVGVYANAVQSSNITGANGFFGKKL